MPFASLIRWLLDLYIDWHVCRQFCAFRKADSNLKYTHVHLLRRNPRKVTGLGHDDETNLDDEGHAAVTDSNGTRTQVDDAASIALRDFTLFTAYFHEGTADGECDEGFRRIRCKCARREGPPEDIWVCYTLDHKVFTRWYESQIWEQKVGRYAYPHVGVGVDVSRFAPMTLRCGTSVVLRNEDFKAVTNCAGFGGPGDGENQMIQDARARLEQAYARISCSDNCIKSKVETFRGWMCVITPEGLRARTVVQWTVTCSQP